MKTILLHFTLWCLVPFGASLGVDLLYYTLQSLKREIKKNFFFLFTGTIHGSFSAIFTEYLEGSSQAMMWAGGLLGQAGLAKGVVWPVSLADVCASGRVD